jgi:hypothetical protein
VVTGSVIGGNAMTCSTLGVATNISTTTMSINGSSSNFTTGVANIVNTNTVPATSLSILAPNIPNATGTNCLLIGKEASNNNSFQLQYNHVGIGSTSNYIWLVPYGGGTGGTLYMNAGGNVGIGVTNPVGRLSLQLDGNGTNNTATWSSSYALFGTSVGNPNGNAVAITYNNAENYGALLSLNPGFAWRPMYYSALSHNFRVSNVVSITIDSNGNVGIGTTNPNALLTVNGNSNIGSSASSVTTIAGTLNQTSGQSGGPYAYQSQWDTASTSTHTVGFISQLHLYTGGPYTTSSLFNNMMGIITIYVRNTALTGYSMTQFLVGHASGAPTGASQLTNMTYSSGAALYISYSFDGASTGNIYVNTNQGGVSPSIQVCWIIKGAT